MRLDLEEEQQILAGDGVGDNLSGLITEATPFAAQAGLPDQTRLDRLRLALLQLELGRLHGNLDRALARRLGGDRVAEGRREPLPLRQSACERHADALGQGCGCVQFHGGC